MKKPLHGILIIAFGVFLLLAAGLRSALIYTTGLGIGVLFVVGSIGFTSAWRVMIIKGDPSKFYGQLIMLAVGVLVFIPVLNAFPTLHKTVAPLTWSSMFGAALFGIGMQLGDGCGSGTIVKLGYNRYSQSLILPFIIGSTLGSVHLPGMIRLGGFPEVDFAKLLNVPFAIIIQWGFILVALLASLAWKRYKRFNDPFSWAENKKLYYSTLAVIPLALVYLLLSGQPWGISYAIGLWGAKMAQWVGINIADTEYWSYPGPQQTLMSSVLFDVTSLSNFGIILGAWFASIGKEPARFKSKGTIYGSIAGGFLMGYGAQLAFGCNIGPYFSGISSGSLHGWSWLFFAMIGGIVGVALRKRLGYERQHA